MGLQATAPKERKGTKSEGLFTGTKATGNVVNGNSRDDGIWMGIPAEGEGNKGRRAHSLA